MSTGFVVFPVCVRFLSLSTKPSTLNPKLGISMSFGLRLLEGLAFGVWSFRVSVFGV